MVKEQETNQCGCREHCDNNIQDVGDGMAVRQFATAAYRLDQGYVRLGLPTDLAYANRASASQERKRFSRIASAHSAASV